LTVRRLTNPLFAGGLSLSIVIAQKAGKLAHEKKAAGKNCFL
jgi:hypothetical protein